MRSKKGETMFDAQTRRVPFGQNIGHIPMPNFLFFAVPSEHFARGKGETMFHAQTRRVPFIFAVPSEHFARGKRETMFPPEGPLTKLETKNWA